MQQQAFNLNPITGKNKKKTQYLITSQKQEEDPHANLTLAQRMAMKPSELVPQLSNPALRKRELKILEKDRKKFQELEQSYEVSETFEQNLYQGTERSDFYEG